MAIVVQPAMWSDLPLILALIIPVILCPFTKVEETFGIQALHDFHEHKFDLSSYDHLEFSGVVPRSFVGLLYVYLLSYPQRMFASSGLSHLLIVRGAMAVISFFVLRRVTQALERRRAGSAWIFALLFATQFHLPFYLSRSLGNTFGCWCFALGLAGWIDGAQNHGFRRAAQYFTMGSVIFRFETAIILAAACAYLFFTKKVSLTSLISWVMLSAGGSLLLTCAVDSYFWGPSKYPSLSGVHWPEFSVFLFNGPEGKSSSWGVMPFHWYFSSALPKALGPQLLAIPLTDAALLPFCAPIAVLSFLGHKELRFIFPSILAFTAYAAMNVAKRLYGDDNKHVPRENGRDDVVDNADATRLRVRYYSIRYLFSLLLVLSGLLLVALRLGCSYFNYPGAHALRTPNSPYPFGIDLSSLPFIDAPTSLPPLSPPITLENKRVHLDTFTTTVGVSRFVHPVGAHISKEGEPGEDVEWALNEKRDVAGFELVSWQLGFSRIRLWPPRLVLEPQVYVLKRSK